MLANKIAHVHWHPFRWPHNGQASVGGCERRGGKRESSRERYRRLSHDNAYSHTTKQAERLSETAQRRTRRRGEITKLTSCQQGRDEKQHEPDLIILLMMDACKRKKEERRSHKAGEKRVHIEENLNREEHIRHDNGLSFTWL